MNLHRACRRLPASQTADGARSHATRNDRDMTGSETTALRQQLVNAINGHESHIDFDSAMEDFPADMRGRKPPGAPHSAWQLLEHMRIAQRDILEFCRNPNHKSPNWPDEYWPKTAAPPDLEAWNRSIREFQKDSNEMDTLIQNAAQDLFKSFEHGNGQTLLREALLVATHNSYHLGQIMFLKKMLLSERTSSA